MDPKLVIVVFELLAVLVLFVLVAIEMNSTKRRKKAAHDNEIVQCGITTKVIDGQEYTFANYLTRKQLRDLQKAKDSTQ